VLTRNERGMHCVCHREEELEKSALGGVPMPEKPDGEWIEQVPPQSVTSQNTEK